MRLCTLMVAVCLAYLSSFAYAQPFRPDLTKLVGPEEIHHHLGVIPKSVESLVSTSDIIVKGRYGRLISHGPFWGYNETRESVERRPNARPELVDKLAIPLSEYQIEVEEVLKGPLTTKEILLHVIESDIGDKRFTDETVERLFFLTLNPDGMTYGRLGVPYILNNRNGFYTYDFMEDFGSEIYSDILPFAPTMEAAAFEEHISQEIRRQSPAR